MTASIERRGHKPVEAAQKPKFLRFSAFVFGKLWMLSTTSRLKADRNGEIIIFLRRLDFSFPLESSRVVNTKRTQTHFFCFLLFLPSSLQAYPSMSWFIKTNSRSLWPIFSIRMEVKMPSTIVCRKIRLKWNWNFYELFCICTKATIEWDLIKFHVKPHPFFLPRHNLITLSTETSLEAVKRSASL